MRGNDLQQFLVWTFMQERPMEPRFQIFHVSSRSAHSEWPRWWPLMQQSMHGSLFDQNGIVCLTLTCDVWGRRNPPSNKRPPEPWSVQTPESPKRVLCKTSIRNNRCG
ncbi:hypothetical protein VTN77DRAFT_1392 [Rasamsonia byssochlamydoides]|uniref:uncharacterized protein n=1 Tax=Rasamsonia byssochlamydoides TaxID=89139 RepID=UPI003742F497